MSRTKKEETKVVPLEEQPIPMEVVPPVPQKVLINIPESLSQMAKSMVEGASNQTFAIRQGIQNGKPKIEETKARLVAASEKHLKAENQLLKAKMAEMQIALECKDLQLQLNELIAIELIEQEKANSFIEKADGFRYGARQAYLVSLGYDLSKASKFSVKGDEITFDYLYPEPIE